MMQKTEFEKTNLHPRNAHRNRYDFSKLIKVVSELKNFVSVNSYGDPSIDFANPAAVKALNKALLKHFYKINFWEIPDNYLCPPIPGRADYLHYIADLLGEFNDGVIPQGPNINGLDIGVAANCIYPLLGNAIYGWNFTASDIDQEALRIAQYILNRNFQDSEPVKLLHQPFSSIMFKGIIQPDDRFDFVLCNPPFHESAEEARKAAFRKVRNLTGKDVQRVVRNFSGGSNELWCRGGEKEFISNMIAESRSFKQQCFWFTSLVSKSANLDFLQKKLATTPTTETRIIDMSQGHKSSRLIAWTFLDKKQQIKWREERWKK